MEAHNFFFTLLPGMMVMVEQRPAAPQACPPTVAPSVERPAPPRDAPPAAFAALAAYGSGLVPAPAARRPPNRSDAPLVCTLCNATVVRTAYALRTRLCIPCMRAPTVEGGRRFCQRCHRLHPLSAFKGSKHSCEVKLVAGSARRQRQRAATEPAPAAAAAPAPPPPVPRTVGAGGDQSLEEGRLQGIELLTELLQSTDRHA